MIENFKLHVFRVVADTLNFSKAAEELHLSQPAVTSQVRSLEEGLGIALFDTVGRNATLTRANRRNRTTCSRSARSEAASAYPWHRR
jgi:DNA-binding transcriptional LysR family regulator